LSTKDIVRKHIGILGAAFDPPTLGHKSVVTQALEAFDEILLVPSINHAFGKSMSNIEERLKLLALFSKEFPTDRVCINLIEQEINQVKQGPIYTIDVLNALEKKNPNSELKFIIGPDNAKIWHKFNKADEISKRWGVFQAEELLKVHSSDVRAVVMRQDKDSSQLLESLSAFVEPSIAQYIIENKLYQS
jgi:nicotinate-nucleotide adenylyltransferase